MEASEIAKQMMLCNSITEEEAVKLDETTYCSQEKKDGERLWAIIINKDVLLINRRGKICNFHFEEVVEDLKQFDNGIIDCEIVSQDEKFENLQRRALTKDMKKIKALTQTIPVYLYAFDIIKYGDEDLRAKPLKERLGLLNKFFEDKNTKFCKVLETKPIKEMLEIAHSKDGEGIVIKKINGIYEGRRSDLWLKCKFMLEEDIKFTKFSENPKGVRVETDDGVIACQVAGENSKEVKQILENKGEITLTLQFLEKFKRDDGKFSLRFPSFKKIVYE